MNAARYYFAVVVVSVIAADLSPARRTKILKLCIAKGFNKFLSQVLVAKSVG